MEIPPFSTLQISTKTVEIYTNLRFDLDSLFKNIPIYRVDNVPLTKKKKRPDIGKIFVDPGKIISARRMHGGLYEFRGIVTRHDKQKISRLRKKRDIGTLTVTEQKKLKRLESVDEKSVLDFQNQVCIIMNVGTKQVPVSRKSPDVMTKAPINLNIMLFKNNFKIVGCLHTKEAYNVIRILWTEVQKIGCYELVDNKLPRFIVDDVMINVNFQLGFMINRKKLNEVLNKDQYSEFICSSIFETTSHTNIKIRMPKICPKEWYNVGVIFQNSAPVISNDGFAKIYRRVKVKDNPYKNKKNEEKGSKYHTFLVPRTGKVIVSGKYMSLMEEQYNFFRKIILEHKDEITERFNLPT